MKIYGNTVGTTLPKPNFDQTDPKKGDYIKGDRSFTKGDPGAVFIPSVDEEGNLSWSNNGGLENPPAVNIVGKDGKTPVKGEDYYTEADKLEMADAVLEAIPLATDITVERLEDSTLMNLTLSDGTESILVIGYDEAGNPASITVDGNAISLEFIDHILKLFATGDVCEDVTGGWSSKAYAKGSVTEKKAPSLTLTGDMDISMTTEMNSAQGSVLTGSAVDLTNYSKLCFNVKSLSSAGRITFGITTDPSSSYTMELPLEAAVGLNTLDISTVTGSYTVAIAVTAYMDTTTKAVIDSIYLE